MRHDKVICTRLYPVEQFPGVLITIWPTSYHLGAYLCNPRMKDTVYSLLAAVSAK